MHSIKNLNQPAPPASAEVTGKKPTNCARILNNID